MEVAVGERTRDGGGSREARRTAAGMESKARDTRGAARDMFEPKGVEEKRMAKQDAQGSADVCAHGSSDASMLHGRGETRGMGQERSSGVRLQIAQQELRKEHGQWRRRREGEGCSIEQCSSWKYTQGQREAARETRYIRGRETGDETVRGT